MALTLKDAGPSADVLDAAKLQMEAAGGVLDVVIGALGGNDAGGVPGSDADEL